MAQSDPVPLTTFRLKVRGELDAERLLVGPTIVEGHGDATLLATADPEAERKLGSIESVEFIDRVGRAILVPPDLSD